MLSNDNELKHLIFLTDPNRFKEILAIEDHSERIAACKILDDFVICEIMRYGLLNQEGMIQPLRALYTEYVMRGSEEWRQSIFDHIKGLTDQRALSVNALLPFIIEETARRIVSTAVIDYVSLGPLSNDDPMSRVHDIIGMIENNATGNTGAAFGALLSLGDDRVCRLLLPLCDTLQHDEVQEAINCSTGYVYKATVEFYLDWLEGFEGDDRDGLFGLVAAGLAQIKNRAQNDLVMTGRRPFPAWSASNEEWRASYKPIPLHEFRRSIASRMIALERAEPPPRVMPHVLSVWGIEPVTPRSETSEVDDRSAISPGSEAVQPNGRFYSKEEEWWDGDFEIYVLWGILNPNGPTLYCVGSLLENGQRTVFYRWLHFLGGDTTFLQLHDVDLTDRSLHSALRSIHDFRLATGERGLLDVIPTFLIADRGDPNLYAMMAELVSESPIRNDDWAEALAYQDQFGTNFFAKAGAQIKAYYDERLAEAAKENRELDDYTRWISVRYGNLPDFKDAIVPNWRPTKLNPDLLSKWITTVSQPEHARSALGTLANMWEGSISMVSADLQQAPITWQTIVDFLSRSNFRLPVREG